MTLATRSKGKTNGRVKTLVSCEMHAPPSGQPIKRQKLVLPNYFACRKWQVSAACCALGEEEEKKMPTRWCIKIYRTQWFTGNEKILQRQMLLTQRGPTMAADWEQQAFIIKNCIKLFLSSSFYVCIYLHYLYSPSFSNVWKLSTNVSIIAV